MQSIGSLRITVKTQLKGGVALVVGGALGELVGIAFLGAHRIVKAKIGVAAESWKRRLQGERGLNAPIGRGRAE